MANYEQAKWLLFFRPTIVAKIINADDAVGHKWLTHLPDAVAVTMADKLPGKLARTLCASDTNQLP